jgi:translocation and assembly module TamB
MTIAIVLFFANSAPIVKMIADKYAPQYSLSYKSIEGNLIQDLHIKDIRYKDELLAKSARLSWSPWTILQGQIFLHTLDVEDVDMEVIKKLANEFRNDEQNASKSDRIDIDIAIKDSHINFLPMKLTNDISIDAIELTIKQSIFSIKKFKLIEGDLKVNIATNFGTLDYKLRPDERYMLAGFGKIYPEQAFFDRYNIPLQADALKEIAINEFNMDAQRLFISFSAQGANALFDKNYPIDISSLTSELTYSFETLALKIDSRAILNGNDFENTLLTNSLTLDEKLEFHGELIPKKIKSLDGKIEKLFEAIRVEYRGDKYSLDANITSKLFNGNFTSKEYKEAYFELHSKEPTILSSYISLPESLQDTCVDIKVSGPINLKNITKSKMSVQIESNIANIDTTIALNDKLSSSVKIKIPKETLLKNYNHAFNWYLFDDAILQTKRRGAEWDITLLSQTIFADLIYNDTVLKGKIKIDGKVIENLKIIMDADINIKSDEEGKKRFQISSNSLKIGDEKVSQHEIKDIVLEVVQKGEGSFVIPSYNLSYKDVQFFAKRSSDINIRDNQFILKEFWINDQALAKGSYDTAKKKGDFELYAEMFNLKSPLLDISAKINLDAKLDGEKIDISGFIDILEGELKYSLEQKTFSSDSDIIIIQDVHYKEPSVFIKNLSTDIKINIKKPIIYKQRNANITAIGNVSINKVENTNPFVTGMITIPKNSTYQFQGKNFILKESHIYFIGEYDKPLLDIGAYYKTSAYNITVLVTGTPSVPNITFSSRPKLSQEQILAILLFGSQDASGTHSSVEMMKMLGGAIAKSALSDVGIKVDHLILGSDTLEVGKKISDKVTVIYVNEEVSKVKVKYDQSRTVEEVLTISPDSTSVDIYYKKEFENIGDILYEKRD